ncbi:MAG: hypothetical protein ACRDPY_05675 [Streptosporangiaceae bacterium]
MAMPDRRSAPIFAAAAAFVLVLGFGKLFSSNPPGPSPSPSPSQSVSATPTPTVTSSSSSPTARPTNTGPKVGTVPTSPSALIKLTVQATASLGATSGVPITDIPVEVAQDKRNGSVVKQNDLAPEGVQDTSFTWTVDLPAATYQVCVQPPAGTRVVNFDNTHAQQGWFCTKIPLAPGSAPVTFNLGQA